MFSGTSSRIESIIVSQRIQLQKKPVYHRGVVACHKCAAPVYVYKLTAVGDEFSVRCPRCGERGFYLKRDMAVEELPERRKKPRR
jgi:DNA-directed RNA polymerase subunit RPC12/RpoP